MQKSPYDIIRAMVERLIIPKYPFLKIHDIDSYNLTRRREYDVRFIVKKMPDADVQVEIDQEVRSLFKMAGLDEMENDKGSPNVIYVWFKTPRQKEFSFKSPPNYTRI